MSPPPGAPGRAGIRRHRQARSRAISVLTAVALFAGVMVIGGVIVNQQQTVDEQISPFLVAGEPGEWVSARTFEVAVVQVRTAAEVSERPEGAARGTGGVWVLVRVRAVADREVTRIQSAEVADGRGRSWTASDRITQPLQSYRLQPGIPVEAEYAFEVPLAAATDLVLRLSGSALGFLDATAEVPLPLDGEQVERGLSAPEPAVLQPPEVVLTPLVLTPAGSDR